MEDEDSLFVQRRRRLVRWKDVSRAARGLGCPVLRVSAARGWADCLILYIVSTCVGCRGFIALIFRLIRTTSSRTETLRLL